MNTSTIRVVKTLQTAENLFQDKGDKTASVWPAVSHYVAEAYH